MLHKSIRDQNKVTGNPTSQRNRQGGEEMVSRAQSLLAPNKRADKCAFQKEGEHGFHCQRLSDDTACISGKVRPIRSELKLHRNAGDDTDGEIESENLCPKTNGLIKLFIARPQRAPFPIYEEPCQSHGELRKQVVVGEREGKLQPAPKSRIIEIRVHRYCRPLFVDWQPVFGPSK